jgi:hypothetical protein
MEAAGFAKILAVINQATPQVNLDTHQREM